MKIDILPNYFLTQQGIFDRVSAKKLSGKIAGVCYDKEGFTHLEGESEEKTTRRIDMTLNNGHHSVYDHIMISFNIQNFPKILAMILNNENQYTTSEKSARYTPVVSNEYLDITQLEVELYNKWVKLFSEQISNKYGDFFNEKKINKLAMENARYLVSIFMPTQMIYTTSFRQINYIASWMNDYIVNAKTDFEIKLSIYMAKFIDELERLNVLENGLMKNEKHRKLSLFTTNLANKKECFGDVYSTVYEGSFAQYAQAQRHRTLDYQLEIQEDKHFYIPEIIIDNDYLIEQWLIDMSKVKNFYPQGELVLISECGKYEDFILKCKERLCTASQLEIMKQTKEILTKYHHALKEQNHILEGDIEKYTKGARCTFSDFVCTEDCKFKEGKKLIRTI